MTRTNYISTSVDIYIDDVLSQIDTEDLQEELSARSESHYNRVDQLINVIYQKRRTNQDYQQELDELIFNVIGRI